MILQTIDESLLNNARHIHFIGIGGSGMYPIVQILHTQGHVITGSDNNETDTLAAERGMGIKTFMEHRAKNIEGADLIVYTAAIMEDNPELIAAVESPIPAVERSIMLGLLSRRFDNTIGISGTHGKTTVTSMLTQILLDGGFDPSAVIGGKLPAIGGNGRAGKSDLFVVEACEFVDTFLQLSPALSVILNVDEDHLDYFKTLENIIKSFNAFAKLATKGVIVNGDDPNAMKAVEDIDPRLVITFGESKSNRYYVDNISAKSDGHRHQTVFDIYRDNQYLTSVALQIPGTHNILNALAAAVAAHHVGATPQQIREGLFNFTGAGRRFEVLGTCNGAVIADDYAHHPAELEVTLTTAKGMNYNRVWAVFQPFTYSRTALLLNDFAKVLQIADRVLLTPIMGSREKNTYNIYSSDLAEKIPGALVLDTFEDISNYIKENASEGDLVLTLGCGDIYKAAKLMLQ